MGFEVYLDCFENGKPSSIRKSFVRTLFPIVDEESKPDFWSVKYDAENRCKIGVRPAGAGTELVSGIYVERPCGDLLLWEGLFRLMQSGNIVLYFPGCPRPLIANPAAASHLPTEMVQALGSPRCLESSEQLRKAVAQD
ncbi:MAG TPA: hypothetical protein VJX47_14095 [Candidatus Sulfotelmatobacter sp.]|nr:hypothetical protein [Candidatus Sulfotelmatobacter sp.]